MPSILEDSKKDEVRYWPRFSNNHFHGLIIGQCFARMGISHVSDCSAPMPLPFRGDPEGGFLGSATRRKQAYRLPQGTPKPRSPLISWCKHAPLIASHRSFRPTLLLPFRDILIAFVTLFSNSGTRQSLTSVQTVDKRAPHGCSTSRR